MGRRIKPPETWVGSEGRSSGGIGLEVENKTEARWDICSGY